MRWQAKLILVATLGAVASALTPASGVAIAADDLHVDLRYDAPGPRRRCWDEAEFRGSVARRLGYDPFRPGAPIGVVVRVTSVARALEGRIDWQNAGGAHLGERRIVAKDSDCSELLTEVSFAVVLQIELLHARAPAPDDAEAATVAPPASPLQASGTAPPPSAVAAEPAPAPPFPTAAPPGRAEVPRPEVDVRLRAEPAGEIAPPGPDGASGRWSLSLGAGPALAWGLAPSLTADGRLFVEARRRALSLELAGEASYPSTTRQADGLGFRERLLSGSLALCGHRQVLSACALGRGNAVHVTGLDVDRPRSPRGLAVQAGARLAATIPLGGPWSAAAHLDLLGLITPYRVTLNQAGVWDMPRLAALAGLTVAARFR